MMGEGLGERGQWWVCEEAGEGTCEVGGVVGYLVCCEWEDVEVGWGGRVGTEQV